MLTDIEIRKVKPTEQPKKLSDSGGLFLLLTPQGSKLWRMAYRFGGKQKTLYIGAYPAISLNDAREKRDEAKKLLVNNIDPSIAKQALKASHNQAVTNSLEVVAREWGQNKVNNWQDKNNLSKRMLERNVFPWLGNRAISELLPKDLLPCLRRIEDRGLNETAHRTLQICGQVFRYAVATGRADRDITPDLRGALQPAKGEHFAAITEPKAAAELLRCIDGYQGGLIAKSALQIAPMVFVRPGELRAME